MRRFVRRVSVVAVATAVLTAVIAFPLGVLASHQFSDVPTSDPYHGDIDALADAGVTVGCGGGQYCPDEYVTREQMAAFMNRLGALAAGKTPVVNATKVDGLNSTQFARSDVAVMGQTGCHGSAMNPSVDYSEYTTNATLITPVNAAAIFKCQLHLPDGATITSFKTILLDASTTEDAQCAFYRVNWTTAAFDTIAIGPSTGLADTPGITVGVAPDIDFPTVDNATFTYFVECGVFGFGPNIGIYGAVAGYTVKGLPVE